MPKFVVAFVDYEDREEVLQLQEVEADTALAAAKTFLLEKFADLDDYLELPEVNNDWIRETTTLEELKQACAGTDTLLNVLQLGE
jgi:hypothetical protein